MPNALGAEAPITRAVTGAADGAEMYLGDCMPEGTIIGAMGDAAPATLGEAIITCEPGIADGAATLMVACGGAMR